MGKATGQGQICSTVKAVKRHCGKESGARCTGSAQKWWKEFSLGLKENIYAIHKATGHCKPGKLGIREVFKKIQLKKLNYFSIFSFYFDTLKLAVQVCNLNFNLSFSSALETQNLLVS